MSLKSKDFSNQSEVRWCPGCGDHAILKHFQSALAKSGVHPSKTAVISGIGCAARLPYYMNTFGFHTIHGRALPIALGLKLARPDMNVWTITGDGDGLSIGGNHFIHAFRKNVDINVLLFNNHVYGLTKGQYSPTSKGGQISKSSPTGSEDFPLNALNLALCSGANFICRTFDKDASFIQNYMQDAQRHSGLALIEILQNCPIFNDGVFDDDLDKKNQGLRTIRLVHGEPILFGIDDEYTLYYEGFELKQILVSDIDPEQLWIHDETSYSKAQILSLLGQGMYSDFPIALGVMYRKERIKKPVFNESYDNWVENVLRSN